MAKLDLKSMTVDGLKTECKARGLTGYSKLKKDELVEALARWRPIKPKGPAKRYGLKTKARVQAKGKHNRNQAKRKRKRKK